MQKSQQTSHVNRNFVGDVLSIVALSDFHHHWKMHKVKRVFVPPLQIGSLGFGIKTHDLPAFVVGHGFQTKY